MTKKIIFSILTLSLLSFAMHKYYVSILEAAYNENSKTFEISIKFIGHDLEKAMTTAGAPELFLGTEKEDSKANDYIKKYLDNNLHFIVNEKPLTFNFVGKEVKNDDMIYCYIESNKITELKTLKINCTLLTDIFDEQENIIYVNIGKEKLNYRLNKDKVSETHEIKS